MHTIEAARQFFQHFAGSRLMYSTILTSRFARRTIAPLVSLAALFGFTRSLPAYTIGSPEVVAMLEHALDYLENAKQHTHVGGEALIAMTLTKNGYRLNHPRVARAIKLCTDAKPRELNNYEVGLVIIFLCDIGPQKYGSTISAYLKELFRRQDQHGEVWTYGGDPNGDTSQTQYGVLAMWTAMHAGFDVPVERMEKACNWLIRTQSVNGAFGYHPNDPGNYDKRLHQSERSLSLTAAGMGSLYISADMLGLTSAPAQAQIRTELPPALVPVVDKTSRPDREARGRNVVPRYLTRAQIDGNKYLQQNYKIEADHYPFYYLYALERYQSFREFAEGRKEESPFWYNDGVDFLKSTQLRNGSWTAKSEHCGEVINTAFVVLFLIRSTKKAIGAASEGRLRGGVGLPSNDSKMSLYGGRIVAADVTKSLSDLMNLLEDQESDELKDLIAFSPDTQFVVDDPQAYQAQLEQLRRMASHSKYEVRMVAVRALGQARDLDNVPALIYALSDPDPRVARAARDGLRFISRRLDGFGLTDFSKPNDRGAIIQKWKQWYRSIRPDAQFLEGG